MNRHDIRPNITRSESRPANEPSCEAPRSSAVIIDASAFVSLGRAEADSTGGGRSTPGGDGSVRGALEEFHIASAPPSPAPPSSSSHHHHHRHIGEPPHLPSGGGGIVSSKRSNFLVFTRILFKCLDGHPDPHLRTRAKTIVRDCTRRNREGDPECTPLVDAVEARLRGIVGEVHWHRAEEYLAHYIQQVRRRRQVASSASAATAGGRGRAAARTVRRVNGGAGAARSRSLDGSVASRDS